MKKNIAPKTLRPLTLDRELVRPLETRELASAAGGAPTSKYRDVCSQIVE